MVESVTAENQSVDSDLAEKPSGGKSTALWGNISQCCSLMYICTCKYQWVGNGKNLHFM